MSGHDLAVNVEAALAVARACVEARAPRDEGHLEDILMGVAKQVGRFQLSVIRSICMLCRVKKGGLPEEHLTIPIKTPMTPRTSTRRRSTSCRRRSLRTTETLSRAVLHCLHPRLASQVSKFPSQEFGQSRRRPRICRCWYRQHGTYLASSGCG